ncbi:VOC family protein [Salinirubrum litoreum]|uniref:VOC family protein n=1 Tax=Salinirubrum litoreum TaxID=1126234 RepID=A0ABD5R7D5_9EURY|nr:VOC family protein [Salinirubrum litoreum]
MELDHVTVAGRDLDALQRAFAAAGLPPTAGGDHDNGVTHMATVPFLDGVYLELIASRDLDRTAPWWDAAIRHDAGPSAWAIRSDDIDADVARLRDRGLAVTDPETFSRVRPDGVELSWDLAVVGSDEPDRSAPGGLCPFLVSDHTPREARVGDPLDPDSAGVPATGVAEVVVGVADLDEAVTTLREGFDLGAPQVDDDPTFGRVAQFPDAPVSVASGPDWIAQRCDRFGPIPCAYLLEATGSHEATGAPVNGSPTPDDSTERSWFGRRSRPVSGLPESVRLFTVR